MQKHSKIFISHRHRVPRPLAERAPKGQGWEDYRSKQHHHMTLLIKYFSPLLLLILLSVYNLILISYCMSLCLLLLPTFPLCRLTGLKKRYHHHRNTVEYTGIHSRMHEDINCFLSLHHRLATLQQQERRVMEVSNDSK